MNILTSSYSNTIKNADSAVSDLIQMQKQIAEEDKKVTAKKPFNNNIRLSWKNDAICKEQIKKINLPPKIKKLIFSNPILYNFIFTNAIICGYIKDAVQVDIGIDEGIPIRVPVQLRELLGESFRIKYDEKNNEVTIVT